ncbi:MAG: sporulation integral membrane protein YtvI [Lachnospiraceae bacterium]
MQSKYVKTILNLLLYVIGILLICILTPKILRFFMPFVIGGILAVIANPLVRFFEKRLKIVRKHSSLVIIAGVLALVITGCYFAVSVLIRQGAGFIENLPELYAVVVEEFHTIGEEFSGFAEKLPVNVREGIAEFFVNIDIYAGELIGKLGKPTVTFAGNVAKNIPNIIIQMIFAILSAYFFIADRDRIIRGVRSVVPRSLMEKSVWIKNMFSKAVGGYFRAQFKIMGVIALILWVGFMILRLDYAVLWAVLIAVLDFFPFLGTGTALFPWAAFQLLAGDYRTAAGLVIIYLVTQLVRQVIQPKIVGDSIGMDPLTTLIFMFVGYRISSVFGMILAVPIGIIIINLYKSGAFDNLIEGIGQIIEDFNHYRKS